MASQANQALVAGTRLDSYRIVRALASGGFSFVYLAQDAKDAQVLIKEYLPSNLALRTEPGVPPKVAPADLKRFRYGLKCFFEEGRALARLQHPNVVRVLNFFRANETVYLVMRYERGFSLQHHIMHRTGMPDEVWLRSTFAQLLNGLREVHTNKLLHLDIKPANVFVREDGSPLLIDFGAARQMLTEGNATAPTYTPGFAAPEQYPSRARQPQSVALGPWTDIYSVGATLYSCFAAAAPQPADKRLARDEVVPARRAWVEQYSETLLDIVDWCLRLDHLERPQSVFALQKALLGEKEPERKRRAPFLGQLRGALKLRPK
jgi:serine/threonine protein kinase